MSFDWQTIAAPLAVLAALLYVARSAWARLRSMRPGAPAQSAGDCGSCGGDAKSRATAPQAKVLVQIGRTRGGPPRP